MAVEEKAKRKIGRPSRGDEYKCISITLSKANIGLIESESKALGVNRSTLVARCITSYLEGKEGATDNEIRTKFNQIKEILKSGKWERK